MKEQATTRPDILHFFGQEKFIFFREKSENLETLCLWQPCVHLFLHRQLFRSLRARNLTAVFVHNIEIKMAAKRARMVVDYNQLNSFSSVVLYDNPHTCTRKTYKNKFNVERIIYRRKDRNVSIEANTWCHCTLSNMLEICF